MKHQSRFMKHQYSYVNLNSNMTCLDRIRWFFPNRGKNPLEKNRQDSRRMRLNPVLSRLIMVCFLEVRNSTRLAMQKVKKLGALEQKLQKCTTTVILIVAIIKYLFKMCLKRLNTVGLTVRTNELRCCSSNSKK